MLGASGLFGSGYYLLSVAEFDPITLVWGFLDPQMAYIGASMLAGAGGSAAGVLLGGTAWGLLQKRYKQTRGRKRCLVTVFPIF